MHSSRGDRSASSSERELVKAIRRLRATDVYRKWHDPTRGSKLKRQEQLAKCGPKCYGLPDPMNPKYPVCDQNCKPVCDGISAAMTYAAIYRNSGVRKNLAAALAACHDIRRELEEKDHHKKKKH